MTYPTQKLADYLTFSNGRSSPGRSNGGPYRVFGSNGIIGYAAEANAPPATTVIGRVGTYCGSLHFSKGASWVTDNAMKAVAKSPDEGRFWYYALGSADLSRLRSGSGQPLINQRALNTVELPVPDRHDRLAIGELLGSLDDKVELNQRMNETLGVMAQAIFRDWFVDFGPTRRKLEGATDPVTIMGGLVQDPATAETLASSFPDQLDEWGRPLGWEEHSVGDAFDLVMGQSPPGSTYNETGDGLPFFQGRRDFSARFPVARVYCTAPTRTARKDWTLVSVRAPVGDVNRAEADCCIGRGVGALSHKQGLLSFTYYAVLNLKPALAAFDGDGTVFGSVNQKQMKALRMLGGMSPLARTYDDLAQPIDAIIRLRTAENRTLAAARDLLLPKLMSGEIRLREAEEMLEAVQ